MYYYFWDSKSPLLDLMYRNYTACSGFIQLSDFRQMNASALNDYKDMD